VGKLRSAHAAAQKAAKDGQNKKYLRYGLDLLNGQVRDNVAAGVLEPTMSKVKSLKSAFEAAVSLLRIDDAITCAPGEYMLSFSFFFPAGLLIRLSRTRSSPPSLPNQPTQQQTEPKPERDGH
jgi:TCP-1/cpn60 chaperonin family